MIIFGGTDCEGAIVFRAHFLILCNILLILYMHLWNISASTSDVLNCIYVFVYLFGEKFGLYVIGKHT